MAVLQSSGSGMADPGDMEFSNTSTTICAASEAIPQGAPRASGGATGRMAVL